LEAKRQLDDLIKKGKVRTSRSESAAPTLFVQKADGTKRWCMDLRRLNEITISDSNQAPLQETAREKLRGAKYFTRLDMRDGYHHIRIKTGDEHKTAFLTEYGLYEWTVMCFGLKNAPAEFARYMSDNLREYLNDFVVVYFDDIVIYSDDLDEHWKQVRKVLERLREKRINLKLKKCEFAVKETKYLGHIVNGESTRMEEEKLRAILEWPTPKCCTDIEEFRGMAGYYRQYIDHFTKKMEPLNQRIKTKQFEWNEVEERAFKEIKDAYRKNQILILHDDEKQTWVHADASDYAIGAEISQKDSQGRRRPVLFYSRKLLPAEMNYTTADKEMLAIVQTMRKFRHLLQGTKLPVIVKSDHRNLTSFMTTKELNARQARWAEDLCSYNFKIEHIKGKENVMADALSRRADYRDGLKITRDAQLLVKEEDGSYRINQFARSKMVTLTVGEEGLMERIRQATKRSEREDLTTEPDGYKRFRGLIFIPKEVEREIIERHHADIREGHPGITRTMEKIQRGHYFPGMYRKVKRFINECEDCMRNKNDYKKAPGEMRIEPDLPERPWKRISVDFLEMPPTHHSLWKGKLDELMVVVDGFSKQTILIPTRKTATTEEVFHLLWERVFAVFGVPERMVSDRDRIFKTEKWRLLMSEIGVTRELSTAYHQQTDGQTERKIQELRAYYRHYLEYEQSDWITKSPIAQYAVNDAISATTGETPNFITFGTERVMGVEKRIDETGTTHEQRMRIIHQKVRNDIEWQEREMKRYYDKGRSNATKLSKGDRVYIRRRTMGEKQFNIKTKRPAQKLDCVKIGPYEVDEVLVNGNYRIKLPERMRIHPIFHESILVPTKNPPTEQNDILDEYEVEEIVGKRKLRGKVEYLVKWLGYGSDENTWEQTSHLNCAERIRAYEVKAKDQTLEHD
jgi:RNase H-like domain found in reverse transcriptase/Reverse transcriptase (RNA-dependent DNA polymerase)/Integrase zinc binding domain/Chromo (CHRromatin Organisation MOdifier) domain/Integrase core domain